MPLMTRRTNEQWLSDLRTGGSRRETALVDLRADILYGLPYALRDWLSPDDPHFAALAEEVTQATLMRVLKHLDSFEGRSQFTTWVHKIAVRVALTELRRRHWKDVSLDSWLDGEEGERTLADHAPEPERAAERADVVKHLQHMMHEELTPKQLRAMLAVGVKGMPLEEAARRLGMERNALYKLLHDARLRLKRRLAREGLTPAELLAVFERE
ncbi:MAG: sigma-70 family RNA polymerase sigma factor [Acidobacteria bacterium]|nr:sigma-70 family RNA polymerase sigma factor [Acidobacteriota bacterium]